MAKSRTADVPAKRRRPVFVQDFVDVERSTEEVRECFAGSSHWLEPLATAAEGDGEALCVRIGPSWASGLVSHEVHVIVGPSRERDDAIVIPLSWEPSALRTLIPSLDGDLEVAPLGPKLCRLTLSATYVPPLGEWGARFDHALLHRVASSTVRSFLARVAASVVDSC